MHGKSRAEQNLNTSEVKQSSMNTITLNRSEDGDATLTNKNNNQNNNNNYMKVDDQQINFSTMLNKIEPRRCIQVPNSIL